MRNENLCLTTNCKNEATSSRGLCKSCYSSACYAARVGDLSWEELEELGLCLPKMIGCFRAAMAFALKKQNKKLKRCSHEHKEE